MSRCEYITKRVKNLHHSYRYVFAAAFCFARRTKNIKQMNRLVHRDSEHRIVSAQS